MLYRLMLCMIAMLMCACVKNADTLRAHNDAMAEYLYGEGYGDSFEMAKQVAIKDIATSLQVSIKYSQKSSITQNNNSLYTKGISSVYVESSIKNLPNVEVVQKKKEKDTYRVKVRINKRLLENSLLSKLESVEQRMDSITNRCNAVSIKNYDKLKSLFRNYKLDTILYQSLSKNTLYGSDTMDKYQAMLDNLPAYDLSISFEHTSKYNKDIQSIIVSELTKFARITQDSNNRMEVHVTYNPNVEIIIKVYDCKDSVILQIPISTLIDISDYNKSRLRFGPIMYKKIIEATKADI